MTLQGRRTIITGGSQGLGRAIAEHFVRAGASVALCARSEATLRVTAAALRAVAAPDQRIYAAPCDVSDEAQVNAFVTAVRTAFGGVDVLVANAGVYGPMGPTESVPLAEWKRALEVNLYGVLLPCRALVPEMKAAGRGKIVVLSGGGATSPLPNLSAYAASKAAAVRLMETLAEELRPYHVDVNALAPGALNTRMLDEVLAAGKERVGEAFYARAEKQRDSGGVPLDTGARLAVYLASAESDGITGKLISAPWDPWPTLHEHRDALATTDIYCLRRIVPEDRGSRW